MIEQWNLRGFLCSGSKHHQERKLGIPQVMARFIEGEVSMSMVFHWRDYLFH